jgi:hypothetical protein
VLVFVSTCSITAIIACIFEHIQWRSALNDFTAHGQVGVPVHGIVCPRRPRGG